MTDPFQPKDEGRPREPAINAPWTVVALIGLLLGAHAWRIFAQASPEPFALTRPDLEAHRYFGLVSYIFVHASWAHVLTNSAFTLAFGVPVARLMGSRARGAIVFFAFFLLCGVAAAIGYAGVVDVQTVLGHGERPWALVGASGAASGLMGAAARLIEGRGRIGPILGRTSLAMTGAWIAVNAVLGLSGLTPGAAGMPVAWQAHILGYFAGLILITPMARLAGARVRRP
jgi:membrane associated rhomboid family serine protease